MTRPKSIIGRVVTTPAAMIDAPLDVLRLHQLAGRHGQRLGAARADDRGEQKVVPGEENAQHEEGADARRHQRQDRPEGLEARGAVHICASSIA